MLIVIPSYKRTDILPWVVQSIIQSDFSGIAERKQVLIVNNYYPSHETVDNILAGFDNTPDFTLTVLHREQTLPAIDSWFSAINEFAEEDEVVFLLGDDDLMLPWGVRERFREIVRTSSDMLLSDFADRIYFFNKGAQCWLTTPLPAEDQQEKIAQPWEFFPAEHPEASFLSAHCYRNTAGFRKGVELALAWCDSQDWLGRAIRTGMLPFYLPYAIAASGGNVSSLRSKCVLRGAVAEEAIKSTYADGGNTAFYNLCAYDIFANCSLPQYDEKFKGVCSHFRPAIISEFLTMLFDKGIPMKALNRTFEHSTLRYRDLFAPELLKGLVTTCIKWCGLRGMRLRLKRSSKSLLVSGDFLSALVGNSFTCESR